MKKLLFGITIFFGGLISMLSMFIASLINPWSYNDIEGLLGFLLGTKSLFPFIIFVIMSFLGLYISYKEAYLKKE